MAEGYSREDGYVRGAVENLGKGGIDRRKPDEGKWEGRKTHSAMTVAPKPSRESVESAQSVPRP